MSITARCAALLLGAAWICHPALAADDPVVARLNGHDLKLSAVKPLLAELDPATREQAAKNPQALAAIVRGQLGQIALLDEARQKQWDQRPEIQQKIRETADTVVASSYLAAAAVLPAGYPSDAEVKDAYDKTHDQFMVPRQYHLAQIFLAASSDAERRAQDLAARAKAKPADFLQLASPAGDKDSGASASDLGWTADNRIVPEVLTVVQGMTEGEISDPIHTQAGWHIVELLGTHPAGVRPLGEVHDTLVTWLRQKKKQDLEKRYLDQLLIRDQAAINEIALKQALEQTD